MLDVPSLFDFAKLREENERLISEVRLLKRENAILKADKPNAGGIMKLQIIEMVESGLKSCHIASKIGCSREYVSRVKTEYKKALTNQG